MRASRGLPPEDRDEAARQFVERCYPVAEVLEGLGLSGRSLYQSVIVVRFHKKEQPVAVLVEAKIEFPINETSGPHHTEILTLPDSVQEPFCY